MVTEKNYLGVVKTAKKNGQSNNHGLVAPVEEFFNEAPAMTLVHQVQHLKRVELNLDVLTI